MQGLDQEGLDPRLRLFLEQALPAMLRRLNAWKGLSPFRHRDVIDDLRQELALDCLEHAQVIGSLSHEERHARWCRLIDRHHYRLRIRGRQRATSDLDAVPAPSDEDAVRLQEVREAAPEIERLWCITESKKNGGLNMAATARSTGIPAREVRALWQRTAHRLGYDEAHLRFWTRRFAEGLLGLAADLLADAGLILPVHIRRNRPDPQARVRRLRRVRAILALQPLGRELRQRLARYVGRSAVREHDPRDVLADAAALAPDWSDVALWQFEAFTGTGELSKASAAIRRARHLHADPVRCVLARARLLEMRGLPARTLSLIRRALSRWPRDLRLQRCLAALIET